jgi:hypothetical protein
MNGTRVRRRHHDRAVFVTRANRARNDNVTTPAWFQTKPVTLPARAGRLGGGNSLTEYSFFPRIFARLGHGHAANERHRQRDQLQFAVRARRLG